MNTPNRMKLASESYGNLRRKSYGYSLVFPYVDFKGLMFLVNTYGREDLDKFLF